MYPRVIVEVKEVKDVSKSYCRRKKRLRMYPRVIVEGTRG